MVKEWLIFFLLLLSTICVSCNGFFEPVPTTILNFQDNLQSNQTVEIGNKTYPIYYFQADELMVESGSVMAGDAIVHITAMEFTKTISPGKYPVRLTILDEYREGGDKQVAFASVIINTQKVNKWELSHTYPVDSGTGGFWDKNAHSKLDEREQRDPGIFERDLDLVQQNYNRTGIAWANIPLGNGLNQIQFSSGYGDGGYRSYVGYSSDGAIARLVTDFDLLRRIDNGNLGMLTFRE